MREILFRGKYVCDGDWIYGYYIGPTGRDTFHEICDISDAVGARLDVDPDTVGQYTGLKDKNGRRIFEGDILEENYRYNGKNVLHVVTFEGSSFGTKRFVSGKLSDFCIPFDDCENPLCTERETEVIGNIHDNPELLREA